MRALIVEGIRGDNFKAVFKWYLLHMVGFLPIWAGMRLFGFSFESTFCVVAPFMFIVIAVEFYITYKRH